MLNGQDEKAGGRCCSTRSNFRNTKDWDRMWKVKATACCSFLASLYRCIIPVVSLGVTAPSVPKCVLPACSRKNIWDLIQSLGNSKDTVEDKIWKVDSETAGQPIYCFVFFLGPKKTSLAKSSHASQHYTYFVLVAVKGNIACSGCL